jgi:hypothetical protein
VKTLSFFLFSAPDIHLRNLQKMWVDGIMHKSVWVQTMKSLNDEWQEFIFFVSPFAKEKGFPLGLTLPFFQTGNRYVDIKCRVPCHPKC